MYVDAIGVDSTVLSLVQGSFVGFIISGRLSANLEIVVETT